MEIEKGRRNSWENYVNFRGRPMKKSGGEMGNIHKIHNKSFKRANDLLE
jgi:hypothetical protein